MMDTFLLKLTQFEKTGSISINFLSLENLTINFHFRKNKSITFFVTFTILLFDSRVCLPFNNGNELNLKINRKSNRETSKLSENKFSLKKISNT